MSSTFGELADLVSARVDGPHDDDRTAAVARLAGAAVRYLNYATGPHSGTGVTEPATVYAVTGTVAELAYGLGQTLTQVRRWIEVEDGAGGLACDTGQPAATVIEVALPALHTAACRARELSYVLSAAHTAVGHLKRFEDWPRPPAGADGEVSS